MKMTETQRVFTMKDVDDVSQHTMIEVEPAKAEELVSDGSAVKLEMKELSQLERKADELYEKYKREVDEVRASDNPLMTDEVKAYEIDKLEKAVREESEK